jgi:hypothetical protein
VVSRTTPRGVTGCGGRDDSDAAEPAGLTTVAQSLRAQGAACALVALGRPADVPGRDAWRVVERTTTRRPG